MPVPLSGAMQLMVPQAEVLPQQLLASSGLFVPAIPTNSPTADPVQQSPQAVIAPINNSSNGSNMLILSPIWHLLGTQPDTRQLALQQANSHIINPTSTIGMGHQPFTFGTSLVEMSKAPCRCCVGASCIHRANTATECYSYRFIPCGSI